MVVEKRVEVIGGSADRVNAMCITPLKQFADVLLVRFNGVVGKRLLQFEKSMIVVENDSIACL